MQTETIVICSITSVCVHVRVCACVGAYVPIYTHVPLYLLVHDMYCVVLYCVCVFHSVFVDLQHSFIHQNILQCHREVTEVDQYP